MHPYPWPGPQVYSLELHIGKVVLGDRGDYRLEVKAKDICDSCAFKIDVEGTLAGVGARGLGSGWRGMDLSARCGESILMWGQGGHRFSEDGAQRQGSGCSK